MSHLKQCAMQVKVSVFLYVFLSSCNGQIKPVQVINKAELPAVQEQTPQQESLINQTTSLHTIDRHIRSIYQDSSGAFWFGTNAAGVFRYDSKTLTQFTVKDGLANNQVINIQEDGLGNMWFGTGLFGICKYDGGRFTTYTNNVNTTHGTEADWKAKISSLWFYAGGGVFRYSSPSLDYLPFAPSGLNKNTHANAPFILSSFAVYAILQDSKRNVWFGTQAQGVCRYDGKSLTWFKEKGLAGPAVLSLFENSKGNLWFGNNGAGLFRFDGSTLTNFTEEKGLGNAEFRASGKSGVGTLARVYAINEDNDGNIWIGTVDAGAWKYDGINLTNYTTRNGLTDNALNTIYKDRSGELWFGTDTGGICRFNGTSFNEFMIN